ncbi:MAG: heme ABC transporter permease CcmC [Burkholderiaceae bacterium]
MSILQPVTRLSSPPVFFEASGTLLRMMVPLAIALCSIGVTMALFFAPTDVQQGEVYRVLYVHVPAAWMSMLLYVVASGYAVIHWIYRSTVSAVMLRALLPTGAWMTLAALVTGSLWGKPTWGTYWIWDARLSTELLLLFIYIGLIALASLVEDESKTDRVLALFTVIGLVNIPLIYFSVVFWNTLHQGASIGASGASRMADDMKLTLLVCTAGLWLTCASLALARARWLLLQREEDAAWTRKLDT